MKHIFTTRAGFELMIEKAPSNHSVIAIEIRKGVFTFRDHLPIVDAAKLRDALSHEIYTMKGD